MVSCERTYVPTDDNTRLDEAVQTSRIYHSTTPLVPETDMAFVQDLFKNNNLSFADREVWLLRRDVDSTGQPSPGRSFVFCNQFYRGLEISSSEVIFWFNNEGIYYYMVGELFTGITLDTIPGVSLKDAGMLFYRGIVGDRLYADSLRSFRSRGFNAELGIRDLNLGTNYTSIRFVLAWNLHVNGLSRPSAWIRADSLQLLYYDSGVYNR